MLIFGVQPQWFSDEKPFVQHLIRKPGRKDLKYGAGYATDYGTDYGEDHEHVEFNKMEHGKMKDHDEKINEKMKDHAAAVEFHGNDYTLTASERCKELKALCKGRQSCLEAMTCDEGPKGETANKEPNLTDISKDASPNSTDISKDAGQNSTDISEDASPNSTDISNDASPNSTDISKDDGQNSTDIQDDVSNDEGDEGDESDFKSNASPSSTDYEYDEDYDTYDAVYESDDYGDYKCGA